MSAQPKLLTIAAAASKLGVSTKTLRRWEAKGIINARRTKGGQRRYSLLQLSQIQRFKQIGTITVDSLPTNISLVLSPTSPPSSSTSHITNFNSPTSNTTTSTSNSPISYPTIFNKIIPSALFIIIGFFFSTLVNLTSIFNPIHTQHLATTPTITAPTQLEQRYPTDQLLTSIIDQTYPTNKSKDISIYNSDTYHNINYFNAYLYIQTYHYSKSLSDIQDQGHYSYYNNNDPPPNIGDHHISVHHPPPISKSSEQGIAPTQLQSHSDWISSFYGGTAFFKQNHSESGQSTLYLADTYMGSDQFQPTLTITISNHGFSKAKTLGQKSQNHHFQPTNCTTTFGFDQQGDLQHQDLTASRTNPECKDNYAHSTNLPSLYSNQNQTNDQIIKVLGATINTDDNNIANCAEINHCMITIPEASDSAQITFTSLTSFEPFITIKPVQEQVLGYTFETSPNGISITLDEITTQPIRFYWNITNLKANPEDTINVTSETTASATHKQDD